MMPCDIKYQFGPTMTAEAFNALPQSPAMEANARPGASETGLGNVTMMTPDGLMQVKSRDFVQRTKCDGHWLVMKGVSGGCSKCDLTIQLVMSDDEVAAKEAYLRHGVPFDVGMTRGGNMGVLVGELMKRGARAEDSWQTISGSLNLKVFGGEPVKPAASELDALGATIGVARFTELPKAAAAWKAVAEAVNDPRGRGIVIGAHVDHVLRRHPKLERWAFSMLAREELECAPVMRADFSVRDRFVSYACETIEDCANLSDGTIDISMADGDAYVSRVRTAYERFLARRSAPKLMGRPHYSSAKTNGGVRRW